MICIDGPIPLTNQRSKYLVQIKLYKIDEREYKFLFIYCRNVNQAMKEKYTVEKKCYVLLLQIYRICFSLRDLVNSSFLRMKS